jgi:hypothetical protein
MTSQIFHNVPDCESRLSEDDRSIASDPGAGVLRAMSAMRPIATQVVHRGELTRCAKSRHMQCSKYRRFIRAVSRREVKTFLEL